jgi:hypothetical protein
MLGLTVTPIYKQHRLAVLATVSNGRWPAGTVATEMPWVVFPGGTVLNGHKKTVTSAYRVRYGCANREAPLSCRWRGKALLNRVGVIELERLLREV